MRQLQMPQSFDGAFAAHSARENRLWQRYAVEKLFHGWCRIDFVGLIP